MSGQPQYYLGCVQAAQNSEYVHFHHPLSGIATLDIDVLKTLVDEEVQHEDEGCAFIASRATRRTECRELFMSLLVFI